MEKIPDPKEIEKDISNFLSEKYGGAVRMITPVVLPHTDSAGGKKPVHSTRRQIHFDLTPDALIGYLDQYIIKQDQAKEVLATKICTHFNRIQRMLDSPDTADEIVGGIKNNVLMIGPTGVGKTYMIKLIAKKIGVPFVKGDATKFSETGYVGGDVEDLVRDLVREADDDIELAQCGIIYIDEIDKIAGNRNIVGADVSRTGVQRALLKPMEETEVDLKVPHDPVSMFQELESFRKTGNREKRTVNTRNILFIMSGAFSELPEIIEKRLTKQGIGFGARLKESGDPSKTLAKTKSEDLVQYGFESEFIGRLPVRAVFERLTESDLYQILKNPNNPIILGKKLDFAAYDIDAKFEDQALTTLAHAAFAENTGARGLVSAVENRLLAFERRLPSSALTRFPVTRKILDHPEPFLEKAATDPENKEIQAEFDRLADEERQMIRKYIRSNRDRLSGQADLTLTESRINLAAEFYTRHPMDIDHIFAKMRTYYNEAMKVESTFKNRHDIHIVLENDAVDTLMEILADPSTTRDDIQKRLGEDFALGFKLIREKTGKDRFFITRKALLDPEKFINHLIKTELAAPSSPDDSRGET
ncbi:MAG: ATPase [Deltaproteobacteria bacterium]|nr:MAG: ATPase [Deltaproteobacteria bacterium]